MASVAVATLLMLVQVGIYYGFAEIASAPIRWIGGDVWVMSADSRFLDHSPVLPAGSDASLRSHPCARSVRAAIITWSTYRRESGALDSIELVGTEGATEHAVPWSMVRGVPADLDGPGRISLDVLDTDVVGLRDPIGAPIEIGGRTARVGALTRGLRGNFGLHPISFGSARTVRTLAGLGPSESTFWVADLSDATCAPAVIAQIERDPTLRAMRTADFAARAERDLLETSGIGVALGFIALLGFAVAAAVVAQTLLASLHAHRRELAMLKALGATPLELFAFVGYQAAFLAVVGTTVGTGLSFVLRRALTGLSVPVILPTSAVALGVATVLLLCAAASLSSVRTILELEANEVLR
jgi:putative ABC transport system permease protein